jgi:hypothetical protein
MKVAKWLICIIVILMVYFCISIFRIEIWRHCMILVSLIAGLFVFTALSIVEMD